MIDEATLSQLEKQHERGLTSVEILELLATHDVNLSEATLRKYVQLGLLPRSVRVGRKGKHRGSQGIYPVSVLRQILGIKKMLGHNYTIEQIQREFLFMRGDLEQLERTLKSLFEKLDVVVEERRPEPLVQSAALDMGRAREMGDELIALLRNLEDKLTSRARLTQRVAAS